MNLHRHGRAMMSSSSSCSFLIGVAGNASQANYGAGNAFQVASARHRTSCGKPAVALDLGAVTGAGYVVTAAALRGKPSPTAPSVCSRAPL